MFDTGASALRLVLFSGGLFLFLGLEPAAPCRRPPVSKKGRRVGNLALTLFNSIVLRLVFGAAVVGPPSTRKV